MRGDRRAGEPAFREAVGSVGPEEASKNIRASPRRGKDGSPRIVTRAGPEKPLVPAPFTAESEGPLSVEGWSQTAHRGAWLPPHFPLRWRHLDVAETPFRDVFPRQS